MIITNKPSEARCIHDPNRAGSTLERTPYREALYPDKGYFICTCCKRLFVFIKKQDGTWKKSKR